jgi:hypothetical protein
MQKHEAEADDVAWATWYFHYHSLLLQKKRDFLWHVKIGLNINFEAASFCTLIAAVSVPAVRHWWFLLPASFWVIYFFYEMYANYQDASDRWWSLETGTKILPIDLRDLPFINSRRLVSKRNLQAHTVCRFDDPLVVLQSDAAAYDR